MAKRDNASPLSQGNIDITKAFVPYLTAASGYGELQRQLPVETKSVKSLKDILSKVGTIQTNKTLLEILNQKEQPTVRKGIVGTLLDPEKGLLFAPARAGSALVADIFNLAQESDGGVLQEYNPIEAAVRSARGEFAITGGDIIPTKDQDSILTRSAKLGGALLWDILTDPTSYLGGASGTFSRKALAESAANPEVMLNVIDKIKIAATQKGLSPTYADDLVEKLASMSKRFVDGELQFVDEVVTEGAAPTIRRAVNIRTGEEVSNETVKRLAADTMTNLVGGGLQVRGRAGVFDNLYGVMIDEAESPIVQELVQDVFEKYLPRELAGGLYIINPITGKRYGRIMGGHGTSNPVKEAVNRVRFPVTLHKERFLTKEISGEYGPAWAAVIDSLNPKRTGNTSITTVSDYLNFKNEMMRKAHHVKDAAAPAVNAVKMIVRTREEILERGGEQVAKAYDNQLTQFVWDAGNYSVGDIERIASRSTTDMDAAEYAAHAAQLHAIEIRKTFQDYAEIMRGLGIEIGMQENYVPLMLTREAIEYLRKYEPKIGMDFLDFYSGELKRTTFEILDDVGMLRKLIQETDDAPVRVFGSPAEANKRARELFGVENFFETNMVDLMARYSNWASGRIATERISQNLQRLGVIAKVQDVVVNTVNANNAAAFLEGTKTLSVNARKRLQNIVDSNEKQLRELADEDGVNAERSRRKGARTSVNNRLRSAAKREAAVREELSTVNASIRKSPVFNSVRLRNLLNRKVLTPAMKQHIVDINDASKSVRRLQSSISRANKKLVKHDEQLAILQTKVDELTAQYKRSRGKNRVVKEEELAKAERELDEMLQTIDDVEDNLINENELVGAVMQQRDSYKELSKELLDEQASTIVDEEFAEILDLINRRTALQEQLIDAKKNRKELSEQLRINKLDSLKLNAQAVRSSLDAYLQASDALRQFERTLNILDPDTITDAQKATLEQLKKNVNSARKTFKKTIGWTAKKKNARQTAGREWAQKVYDLAQGLNKAQRQVLQILTDPEGIDDFIKRWYDMPATHSEKEAILTDFMRSYSHIRQYVTDEDLAELTELQRVLLDPTGRQKERVTDTFTGKYTARVSQVRSDIASVERKLERTDITVEAREALETKLEELNRELFRINFFADNNTLVGAGKSVSLPKAFHNIYAPDGVRQVLERMYWVRQNPTDFQRYIREIYDPLSFLWKTQATVGRGFAYIWNNIIGGVTNNYIYGVTVRDHFESKSLMKAWDDAFDAARAAEKKTPELTPSQFEDIVADTFSKNLSKIKITATNGENIDAEELMRGLFETPLWHSTHSVITLDDLAESFGSQAEIKPLLQNSDKLGVTFKFTTEARSKGEEKFRTFVKFMLTNPVQGYFNDQAQRSELWLRLAAYIRGYKQFNSKQSAFNIATMLHFDYRDLSASEHSIKRFVPFYTWNRYNIPLQLRALFFQQDKIKNIVRVNENLKNAFGMDEDDSWISELMPEWFDKQGGWLTRFGFDGNPIGFFPKIPIYDADKLFQVHTIEGFPVPVFMTPRLQELAQMLGPATTPLEYISNVNWDTGIPYSSEKDKVFRMLTNLAPIVGTSRRAANALTVPLELGGLEWNVPILDESRNVSDAINFFIGSPYGAVTVTERTLTSGAINRIQKMNDQIVKAAQDANIDVEWLRQQIRKGRTIAEIRAMVAAGYGRADLLAQKREIDTLVRGSNRDYMEVISGMRSGDASRTGY